MEPQQYLESSLKGHNDLTTSSGSSTLFINLRNEKTTGNNVIILNNNNSIFYETISTIKLHDYILIMYFSLIYKT